MPDKNQYGLSRYIPTSVRKEVRRRCGFGCVICGNAIITYEHMEPKFRDARRHEPSCITLLCGHHQQESSKGILSVETIKEYDADPITRRRGFANYVFDLGGKTPELQLGPTKMLGDYRRGFFVNDKCLLRIDPPNLSRGYGKCPLFFIMSLDDLYVKSIIMSSYSWTHLMISSK
jgi:hypothetical protein